MKLSTPFVLLEDRLRQGAPAVRYTGLVDHVRCDHAADVDSALDRLERGLSQGLHAAGVLHYELGHALEARLRPRLLARQPARLIDMGLFSTREDLSPDALDVFFAGLGPPPPVAIMSLGHDRPTHAAKVRRLLDHIAAGDIYQANLTFPIRVAYEGDPLRLYAAMRVRQPTAHAALVSLGEDWVLSASPELFLRVMDGLAESRPMKGTVARDLDPDRDRAAAEALRVDPKQRAENIMIVDLIRNDLSRISIPGSVHTPRLLTVETYPDLHTMTSAVASKLKPGVGLAERLAATFPCGSIVGAPKIRAAERLDELEAEPRGVYTGAIGAIAPKGDMELNVAIRTLHLHADGSGRYGVGGGVVADSDPDAEYDEALLKGRVVEDLARDYDLIETFRWSASMGFVRLREHMGRLQRSSDTLGFPFDRTAAEAALADNAARWSEAQVGDQRVRLLLSRSGSLTINAVALDAPGDRPVRVGIASVRLDAGSPFLRHKTTRREPYDAALAEAEAFALDEALLLNRAGWLADGARNTVFVRLEGRLFTPPVSAGALPGVLRACLIEAGCAAEQKIGLDELRAADGLFVGNSLRGLRPAVLV